MLKNTFFARVAEVNLEEYLAYLAIEEAEKGSEKLTKKNQFLAEVAEAIGIPEKRKYLRRRFRVVSSVELSYLLSLRRFALHVAAARKTINQTQYREGIRDTSEAVVKFVDSHPLTKPGSFPDKIEFDYGL